MLWLTYPFSLHAWQVLKGNTRSVKHDQRGMEKNSYKDAILPLQLISTHKGLIIINLLLLEVYLPSSVSNSTTAKWKLIMQHKTKSQAINAATYYIYLDTDMHLSSFWNAFLGPLEVLTNNQVVSSFAVACWCLQSVNHL